jgi:hypothetical protein
MAIFWVSILLAQTIDGVENFFFKHVSARLKHRRKKQFRFYIGRLVVRGVTVLI